jgi:hypothetical protein
MPPARLTTAEVTRAWGMVEPVPLLRLPPTKVKKRLGGVAEDEV